MDTTPTALATAPTGSDRLWTVLCHLSTFIGLGLFLPLVVYLVMRRESEYVAANAREALNFHLSVLIYIIVCIPLAFLIVGVPLMIAIGVAAMILAIVAAVKASDGIVYRYPLTIRLVS